MKRYVSYLRVSTVRQGYSGLGIEAQRTAVKNYLRCHGGEIVAEFVEVESGGRKARPILVQSIAQSKREGATLLIAKLDRLARNVAFVSSLMESGVEFVAADAPYANKLMIHILSAFAEHERELISQRTRDALKAAKARGVRLGVNGAALAKLNQEEARKAAEQLRAEVNQVIENGHRTLNEIACALNDSGLRTRQNAAWSPGTVRRLLKRLDLSVLSADPMDDRAAPPPGKNPSTIQSPICAQRN